jgi:predicted enzyme related to lactoylglutathione lyase
MKAIKSRISIFSENPKELADFYKTVLEFSVVAEVTKKDDFGFSLEIAPGYKLWIAEHSKVDGKNSDPFRIIISIFVDDINSYFKAVRQFDSNLINEEPLLVCSDAPGEERWAGSFFDTEGNCIQMMQMTGK